MLEMKRNIKDSVFTSLFSEPRYARELYVTLHPEDADVREDEIKLLTIANVLSNGMYNDLGMQIRDRLIILMESQTVFSKNIPLRVLFYLAETYKLYVVEHMLHLHGSRQVTIPRAELYMVYTGSREDVPETLRLSELCGGACDAEVTVHVLRGGDSSILGQYVSFCRISDEQRKKYGRTRQAIKETIRLSQEQGILGTFLDGRQKEVVSMMEYIFNQEEIWEMDMKASARMGAEKGRQEGRQEGRREGRQEGQQQIKALNRELMHILIPLGRVGDFLAAAEDDAKLFALAEEFGLVSKYGLQS